MNEIQTKTSLEIHRCVSRRDLKEFENIPEILFGKDPNFVPPFPGSIVELLTEKSAFARHGEVFPFIAYLQGKPVGRIAAVVNRSHNEYHKDKVGFFGFFDFIEDETVAQVLLETAKKELKQKGHDLVRGPFNPSINEDCGLLTEGFDSAPCVMMPYNPFYYVKIYEKLGLKSERNLYAFFMSADETPSKRIARIADRVRRSTRVTLRNVDLSQLNEELKIVHYLYNRTLDRNWGFVPISYEDLLDAGKQLKAILDPNMLIFAEKDGKPVGYSLIIPNINEFLLKCKKHNSKLLRILKFVWLLKTSRPKMLRFMVLGVLPEYRNSGLAALFYNESLKRANGKYVGAELSWVEETNQELMKSLAVMGSKKTKTYQIYGATL